MTANEAYEKAKEQWNTDFKSCFEMEKMFIFVADGKSLDGIVSVDKSTGETKAFNPLIDSDLFSFANKKPVTDFKG